MIPELSVSNVRRMLVTASAAAQAVQDAHPDAQLATSIGTINQFLSRCEEERAFEIVEMSSKEMVDILLDRWKKSQLPLAQLPNGGEGVIRMTSDEARADWHTLGRMLQEIPGTQLVAGPAQKPKIRIYIEEGPGYDLEITHR